MALTERLALLVTLDADGAVKGFESIGKAADRNLSKADQRLDKMASRFQKAGAGMLAGAGLAGMGLLAAGRAASDLEQAVGGTEAVFEENASTIEQYAKGAARNMGLSERAFREATTSIGGQLKRMTGDMRFATDGSVELTRVAADLAATYGGTTAEAVQALGAAFRGEADPAERFNLNLKVGAANAKAVAMGLAESESEVSEAARAQATYALIMEQSADAQGQFTRELGTAAGQMQIANAEFENAKASLGQAVAPIMADVAGKAAGLARGFTDVNNATGGMLSSLAAYGTIGLGALGATSLLVGKAIEMRKVFTDLDGPFRNASGGLSRLGKVASVAGGAAGIGGLAATLIELGGGIDRVSVDVNKLNGTFAATDEAARKQNAAFLLAADSVNDLGQIIDQVSSSNVILAEKMIDQAEAAGLASDRVEKLREITEAKRAGDVQGRKDAEKYNEQIERAATASDKATGPMGGLLDKVRDFGRETGDAADALADLDSALSAMFDPLFNAQDAMVGLREAQDKVTEAIKANSDAIADNDVSQDELNRLQFDAVKAAQNYQSSLIKLKKAVDDGDVSLTDARETLQRWVDQGLITQDQANDAAGAFDNLGAKASELDGRRVVITAHAETTRAEIALAALSRSRVARVAADFAGLRLPGSATGGLITQSGPEGKWGPSDTVPTMLTPGEFVLQKSAVDRIGVDALRALNAGGGLPARGGTSSTATVARGGTEVIQVVLDGRVVTEVVRDRMADIDRRNGRR